MTLEEIKEIAETWFEWPNDKREYVTYTSAMLFACDMQKAERERIKRIVEQVGVEGNHDAWFDCCDTIIERIEE